MRRGDLPPDGRSPSDLLSWDEIIALEKKGVGIEGHGHEHRILSGLSDADLGGEFDAMSSAFARHLGRAPEVIAYPNGDWGDFDFRALPIRYGLTAVFGSARAQDAPYRIRRVLVANENPRDLFTLVKRGAAAAAIKRGLDRARGRR